MNKLTRADLFSLEEYSQKRTQFRNQVIAHKKNRQVKLGGNATLYFEDRLTIQYQIQEMLRVERIFEAKGIEDELEAYNPLIPDGSNWKATFMLEYEDAEERKLALSKLVGIETKVWVQVEGYDAVTPIADEDMERQTEDKTAAVHFLRFELSRSMCDAVKHKASIAMGVNHPHYRHSFEAINESVRESLMMDLE